MQFLKTYELKRKASKQAQIPKRKPARGPHATLEKLDRKNKAKKHLKTTKDGPKDPCAIFRKTRAKQQVPKKIRHAQPQQSSKTWVQPKQALGLKAKPEENHLETTKHWKDLHASF